MYPGSVQQQGIRILHAAISEHGPRTDCSALRHNPSAVLQLRRRERSPEPNSVGPFRETLDLNKPTIEIIDHIL